jgi:hypothetical protein
MPDVTHSSDGARSKLAQISNRFAGFERLVDAENRSRQDGEDAAQNQLKDNIARLEKTLNSEIKRRVEANKALQGMFEAQMATVQDKLEAGLLDRLDQLHSAVGSLNGRVDAVEKEFIESREQYICDIEDKSAMVATDAANLQEFVQNERADRKERETLIVAKLRDLEARTTERLAAEQRECDLKFQELQEDLDVAVKGDGDQKFQDYILEEMAALKNGLVVETQARESADDDVVNALNHYTKAIQDALRVVNTA